MRWGLAAATTLAVACGASAFALQSGARPVRAAQQTGVRAVGMAGPYRSGSAPRELQARVLTVGAYTSGQAPQGCRLRPGCNTMVSGDVSGAPSARLPTYCSAPGCSAAHADKNRSCGEVARRSARIPTAHSPTNQGQSACVLCTCVRARQTPPDCTFIATCTPLAIILLRLLMLLPLRYC